jgi:hypothetical protein
MVVSVVGLVGFAVESAMSVKPLSIKPIAQWLAASLLINFVASDVGWWPIASQPPAFRGL